MSGDSTEARPTETDDSNLNVDLNLDDDEYSEFSLSGTNLSGRKLKLILTALVIIVLALVWWGPL